MPHVYGIEHILYLAVTLSATVAVWLLAARYCRGEKGSAILVKSIAAVLLCTLVWNRISIACYSESFALALVPTSFCGMSSLLFSLATLLGKRDNKALHCVAYVGMLGGLLTVFYPDFVGQADSIFHSRTISGLAHHSITIMLFGAMLAVGYLKPSLKRWYCLPLGLCTYITFGLFFIQAFDMDGAMYITKPILPDTPLVWYVIGLIFVPVHVLLLLGWELLVVRRRGGAAAALPDEPTADTAPEN